MEKLVFGFNCDEAFYEDSLPVVDGFGWLDVSAEDNGTPCRVRFWTDREKMRAFASAVLEKAGRSDFPIEVQWNDDGEDRAFRLRISESETSERLAVQLEMDRGGAEHWDLLCCSFGTSPRHLLAFNAALADLVDQRRLKASLNGW